MNHYDFRMCVVELYSVEFKDQIAKIARTLYEQSGNAEGYDLDNWLEAERIALQQKHESEDPED